MTLRPAAVFSSHMVLQREKPIAVWGTGADGTHVTVSILDVQASAAVEDGFWRVTLPPQSPGEPCVMTVDDGTDRIVYDNVVFGDVWLAGGQSNMEWPLIDAKDGVAEVCRARNADIRHYSVPKCAVEGERLAEMERVSAWTPCVGNGARNVSAVAYWFAKAVYAETGVPVGIINCNWGGTSAAAWMSREQLSRTLSGKCFIEAFKVRVGDKSDEQFEAEVAEHDHKYWRWRMLVDARRAENPDVTWQQLMADCGEPPWPYPAGNNSPYRPSGLHETMLRRVAPYTLKGFLYYQGEEDAQRSECYFEWMCCLIAEWRHIFGDEALPFLLVQLPMYDTSNNLGVFNEEWPLLREAQARVARFVRNTGLAVAIDCGELDNVHPTDKQPVGRRLALQALKTVYDKPKTVADGPFYRYCQREGAALRIFFTGAEDGLELRGDGGFEVAGADGVFHPAAATVEGATLLVSSPGVLEPCAVRYAWRNYCETPLYATNGLPAAPFRGAL